MESYTDSTFSNARRQSILQKQEAHALPTEAVIGFVQKAVPEQILKIKRLVKGALNETYTATTESGKEFIARVALSEHSSRLAQEKWALERCLDAGIPVPKVILLDTVERNGIPFTACVESKLPGTPLDEANISEEQKGQLLYQAGQQLSRIHSIPIDGFGLINNNGKGQYSSVKELFTDPFIAKEKMLNIAREISFDEATLLRAFEIMESGIVNLPATEAKLVHDDFEPKHILVEDGQVTGIIDFELASGGDPVLDLARWHFFQKDKYEVEELIKGYENKAIFSGNFGVRFNLWRLYVGIGHLAYQYQEKNETLIKFAQQEITNDVNFFNEHNPRP